jgi:Ca-activated chloride channel family protein
VPGVDAGQTRDKGDKLLVQLCERTGGQAFFTGDMYELEKAFKKISEELRSQYIVTYRPANQNYDGRTRKIEVRFADKEKADKYEIRTKTEYRAVRDSLK